MRLLVSALVLIISTQGAFAQTPQIGTTEQVSLGESWRDLRMDCSFRNTFTGKLELSINLHGDQYCKAPGIPFFSERSRLVNGMKENIKQSVKGIQQFKNNFECSTNSNSEARWNESGCGVAIWQVKGINEVNLNCTSKSPVNTMSACLAVQLCQSTILKFAEAAHSANKDMSDETFKLSQTQVNALGKKLGCQ